MASSLLNVCSSLRQWFFSKRNRVSDIESGSTPHHSSDAEPVHRSVVSVDAPETFSKAKWTKDAVRRLSLKSHSLHSEPQSVSGYNANSTYTTVDSSSSRTTEEPTYLKTLFHVRENKVSLKLFGSKRGVREEQVRQEKYGCYVIHPCSFFRIYWDVLMLTVLAANITVLPVTIAFFKDGLDPGWVAFNSLSDFLFIIDIVLNFWTGTITQDNTVVLDVKVIRKVYMRRWLILDTASVFPIDYIVMGIARSFNVQDLLTSSQALQTSRLFKLLSLLRLLKLVRFLRYLIKWEELIKATRSGLRIFNLILVMMLLAHWNGCVQFLVPNLQDFPHDSWVTIHNLTDVSVGEQYTWSLFKAISHMLCIGYGRSSPGSVTDAWLTIVSMMLGASFYAVFIGNISTLVHAVDSPSRMYNEKVNQVDQYMRYRKLPQELKQRIHEYYYHRYRGQLFNEEAILKELSFPLEEEICRYNCQELVRSVPFLAGASQSFISSIVTKLNFQLYLPRDIIIKYGNVGHEMFFIQSGVVDVITKDGFVIARLSDGSYFGEICLLLKSRRVASVRAVTVCDLYSLSVGDFHSVLRDFPDIRQLMETVAKERLSMIQSMLSDNQEPGRHIGPGTQEASAEEPIDLTSISEDLLSDLPAS